MKFMRYRVQVLATVKALQYREGPGTTYRLVGTYDSGDSFIASDQYVDPQGTIWFKNEETTYWSIFRSGTSANLKIVYQYPEISTRMISVSEGSAARITNITYDAAPSTTTGTIANLSANNAVPAYNATKASRHKYVEKESDMVALSKRRWDIPQQNQNGYPPSPTGIAQDGGCDYDYTMNTQELDVSVDVIRKNSPM